MINNKFKALFNPFTREIAVQYGDTVSNYGFKELDEWTKISYDGDQNHPNYLHVHLHYEACLQLLFYPRQDGDNSLHEDEGVYFNSYNMNRIPENIRVVYNDDDYAFYYNKLIEGHEVIQVEDGL